MFLGGSGGLKRLNFCIIIFLKAHYIIPDEMTGKIYYIPQYIEMQARSIV